MRPLCTYFLVVLGLTATPLAAQTCPYVAPEARASMFKVAQHYNVFISPQYPLPSACIGQLQDALNAWQYSNANADWDVTFSFTTSASSENLLRLYYREPQLCKDPNPPAACFSADEETVPEVYGPGMPGGAIEFRPRFATCAALAQTLAHEIGHGFGLSDCYTCSNTIMRGVDTDAAGNFISNPNLPVGPTSCDETTVRNYTDYLVQMEKQQRCLETSCSNSMQWDPHSCECIVVPADGTYDDPLIVDLAGDGIRLSSLEDGVWFDLEGGGPRKMSWLARGTDDAWLAIDRNHNGRIDDGRELFSDSAAQAPSDDPNGFLALALFDGATSGGNGDGQIDARDRVFASLLLWNDTNHNGVSEPNELTSLAGSGVQSIDLLYLSSGRRDRYGNSLKYRARVQTAKRSGPGRWAYDVFLRIER